MSDARPSRLLSWLTAAGVLLALVLFGILAGGLVATRVLTVSGMGWDQIAGTLGGLMVGGVLGLLAGVLAVRTFGNRGRLMVAVVALLGCVGVVLYLLATPANVRPMSSGTGATGTSPRLDG